MKTSNHALAPAILTIDLQALADNYKKIQKMSEAAVAGVVKADAYGCGMLPVVKALYKAGCRHFFVATPEEAFALREADKDSQIFVLGGLYEGAEDFYAGRGVIPVLNSMKEAARWSALAKHLNARLPAAFHYDTGMNRLGMGPDDMPTAENLDVRLIMSHFACSDEADHPMNERQNQAFARICSAFPNVSKSLSNSSGIFRSKKWHYDLLRPGYALYGGNPTPEKMNPMKPVVSLKARILQTRIVKPEESAGYSATHIFNKPTRIATVAAGYADGFLRSGSSRTKLYWNGQPCPVLGRVSMDTIIVDIGHLAENPQAGEWMDILGPRQSIDDLAKQCGTIGYEILTSLGHRYHREYR